jgi:hypothetical protein
VLRQFSEQKLQVILDAQVVGLGRFDQTVNDGLASVSFSLNMLTLFLWHVHLNAEEKAVLSTAWVAYEGIFGKRKGQNE